MRHTLISSLSGMAITIGLAVAPAHNVHAARPSRQHEPATIVPFTGTASLTYTSSDSLTPARARKDLSKNEQIETFSVRDATHWRVDVHTGSPIIDSHDQTIVSDGHQVVAYSTLSNHAFRLSNGVSQSVFLLSALLGSRGAAIGTTTANYIRLAKSNPKVKVRSLGQTQILGRTTDVLQISPIGFTTTGSCSGPGDCASKEKGYGRAKVWLDHEHGVVLRYEEGGTSRFSGAARGYRYLVTSITFRSGPSDVDIAYVPPVAVADAPRNQGGSSSGYSSGSGSAMQFQAPPGFIAVGQPTIQGATLLLRGTGNGEEWLSSGTAFVTGIFRGSPQQGFVYIKERIRPLGLPAELMTGKVQTAGACSVWTGTFPDGLRWLAMMRGKIAILVVANKLSRSGLVHYAAKGICRAPIVPQPSASDVRKTALDRLETEIDITHQILGWAIVAAPSASDKTILKGFDTRLQNLDRTVFAIRNRENPKAMYSGPGYPPAGHHAFKDTLQGLKGEIGAAKFNLAQAEAAVQTPADRQSLQQQGVVFDDLVRAVDTILHP